MKVSIQIEIQPFAVPDYVLTVPKVGKRQDGMVEAPKYALRDLDAQTLYAMCREFRDEVFRKAEKLPPIQTVRGTK